MFAVTYLGHQGWLVASSTTRVLIDPLLTDEYSPGYEARMYPRRTIDLSKLPPIDALVLSHEHSDHVNVPTLRRLAREIPVVMPARSARVIRELVEKLGFRVTLASAGDTFSIGDLTLQCFASEHRDDELEEEWANLQLHVAGKDGSFFTYVDGWPTSRTMAQVGNVSVFVHTNNVMDWSVLEASAVAPPRPSSLSYAAQLIDAEAQWAHAPALTIVCGPGLEFRGGDRWLNQILRADSAAVCAALAAAAPHRAFVAPRPGETFEFARGALKKTRKHLPFLRAEKPRERARSKPVELIVDYAPACGRVALDDDAALPLDELAAFLYGRALFRTLHALDGVDLSGRKPAFALVLRVDDGDSAHVFELQTNASRFEPVDCANPIATYALGFECWATDLADVLRGAMLPQRLLGHLRAWNLSPAPLSVLYAVWRFFDFLHRYDAGVAFYDQRLHETRHLKPVVRAGSAALSRCKPGSA